MFDQHRLYGRNRSRATAWGPYSEFCKSSHFWRLPILHSLGCNAVLRGRRGTSWHCHVSPNVPKILVCGRRNTFARLSVDELHFAWPAQHFRCVALRVFRESQSRLRVQWWQRGTWQAWHFVHCRGCVKWWHGVTCVAGVGHRERIILRGRRSSSDPVHFTHSTPHSALSTPHSTLRTLHFTLYTPHSMPYTPHSTLHTLHFTLHTLHCTLHTLHSTLYTSNLTLHTLPCTLHTLHSTLYTLHSTLYTLHFAIHTLHFTLSTPHLSLHTLHFTLHALHSTLYTLHSTLYTLHSTCYTLPCPLYTLHSTLYTSHFPPHTFDFTLHTSHTTIPTSHSTYYIPHSTLHLLHTTYFPLHRLLPSRVYSALVRKQGKNAQDCSNNLFHRSVLLHSGSWAASCLSFSLVARRQRHELVEISGGSAAVIRVAKVSKTTSIILSTCHGCGFPKWKGVQPMDWWFISWTTLLKKWTIWGYPFFRKPAKWCHSSNYPNYIQPCQTDNLAYDFTDKPFLLRKYLDP